MAGKKFLGKEYLYALYKKEIAELWANGMSCTSTGFILGQDSRKPEEDALQEIMRDFLDGKNPFHPLPIDFKREKWVKKIEYPMGCLFKLYHGTSRKELCGHYRKANSSKLNEWLVNHLADYLGVKRNTEDESDLVRHLALTKGIKPCNRSNAEMVEMMLNMLETGMIRKFGDTWFYKDELPPRAQETKII